MMTLPPPRSGKGTCSGRWEPGLDFISSYHEILAANQSIYYIACVVDLYDNGGGGLLCSLCH